MQKNMQKYMQKNMQKYMQKNMQKESKIDILVQFVAACGIVWAVVAVVGAYAGVLWMPEPTALEILSGAQNGVYHSLEHGTINVCKGEICE